jgi:hypothetical protein
VRKNWGSRLPGTFQASRYEVVEAVLDGCVRGPAIWSSNGAQLRDFLVARTGALPTPPGGRRYVGHGGERVRLGRAPLDGYGLLRRRRGLERLVGLGLLVGRSFRLEWR